MSETSDLAGLKAQLNEYGFVTVPNVISPRDADLMAKRVVDIMSAQPDSDELDCHLPSMLEHVVDTDESDLFFSAVTIPVYLELARHVVGEGFQSAGEAMRWTKPGWAGQPLHADGPAGIFARSGHPAPGQWPVINSLIMLSEFTRENGGTLLMPFSHHSRLLPRPGCQVSSPGRRRRGPRHDRDLHRLYLARRRREYDHRPASHRLVHRLSRGLARAWDGRRPLAVNETQRPRSECLPGSRR